MKQKQLTTIILVFLLGAVLLSACSGASAANSWPGMAVTEKAIYSSFNNHVYAVNPGNGSLIWQFPAAGADAKTGFYASPLAAGDMVVAGDFDHSLHGIIAANGMEQWVFSEAKSRWIGAPLLVNDLVIAPNSDHWVYALNKNGLLQWKFETDGLNWAQPASNGETVFIASMDHNLYALRLSDGNKEWSTDLGGAVILSQVLGDDGVLYIGTLGSEMLAVDASNGKILWRSKTPGSIWGKAIIQDGTLYVGDQAGMVNAISTKSGSTLWSVAAGGAVIGAGAAIGDQLFFGTDSGLLVCFDTSGKKLWNITVSGKLYSDINVAGDYVLSAANENEKILQAYDKDGKVIWSFNSPK